MYTELVAKISNGADCFSFWEARFRGSWTKLDIVYFLPKSIFTRLDRFIKYRRYFLRYFIFDYFQTVYRNRTYSGIEITKKRDRRPVTSEASSRIVSARFEELQKHANDQAKRGEVEEGEQGARAYRNSFLHGFVPRLRNTQASVRDEGGGISVRLMWRDTGKEALSFECQCLCLSTTLLHLAKRFPLT